MNPSILLSPNGIWAADVQYNAAYIPGAAAIGLGYISCAMVQDRGSLWYALSGNNVQPTLGVHPAAQAAPIAATPLWALLNAGTVQVASVPTTANDNTEGYAVGTLWIDTVTNVTYTCTSNATGAATWVSVTPAIPAATPKVNVSASTAPGVGNDNTQGYSIGSTWWVTSSGDGYFATSVGTGAAVWTALAGNV